MRRWITPLALALLLGPACGGDDDGGTHADAAAGSADASAADGGGSFDASPYDSGPCACDFLEDICEADMDESDGECACDNDCDAAGNQACMADDLCDTWCDPGGTCVNPDCNALPACSS